MRPLLLAPLLTALLALSTACGSNGGTEPGGLQPTPTSDSLAGGGSAPTQNDLVGELQPAPEAPAQRYTLVCAGVAEGDHPEPAAACAHLLAQDRPFQPLGTDLLCTEIYGGPQTAHVTGRWGGEPVDLQVSRVDGCHITQWDGLGPLLPGPVGVDGAGELPQ